MSPLRAWPHRGALAAAAVLSCSQVCAHEGATTAFAHIVVSGSTVRYSFTLADASKIALVAPPTVEAADLAALAQAVRAKIRLADDGIACAPTPAELVPPSASSASATVVVDFACPGEVRTLEIRDDLPDVLGADLHTLAKIEWPGGTGQFAFATESREARFDLGAAAPVTRGAGSFFWLGVEHILTGYDHLLFLLVLVLGGGGVWSLIKIITAFTVAHSVTLALAVVGIVTLPNRLVEAAIALSIAYVAAENLLARHALSRRWAVSLGFGLVHGFGFASVLRELGLPTEHLALSLAAFNVGVEAGQAAVALPLVWLLLRVRGKPWEPKAATAVSAIVLAVGLALFVERIAFAG
ncbi:MAG TPA: HupE/UreJ family protein [Burkholderiales bacterium]|nr:HupE/UreJ family protein [Burkholderiales bacterium]